MSSKVYLRTFGCQMNEHDSERIFGMLSKLDYQPTDDPEQADLILLNTCAIREKAEQKVLSALGRFKDYKAANPQVLIGVAGCVAAAYGEQFFDRAPMVDLVFGPGEVNRLPELIERARSEKVVAIDFPEDPAERFFNDLTPRRDSGASRFVTVMEGCDNFCAYCIVPYTRGREVSRPPTDVIAEIRALAGSGVREVTLIGQNVNSFGRGLSEPIDFADLLEQVHEIDDIKRIRFTTSHPKDFSQKLVDLYGKLPKLAPHCHLPVQAGSDRILKMMNRKYSRDDYFRLVDSLRERKPDISISTDLIVGFPGETEEDFRRTIDLVERVGYDFAYSFKYSPRPETKAASYSDQVSAQDKKERLLELQQLLDRQTYESNRKMVGRSVSVLVEGKSKKDPQRLTGHSPCARVVNFEGYPELIGKFIDVVISEGLPHSLAGGVGLVG